jgi:rod shape-determining protein MreC
MDVLGRYRNLIVLVGVLFAQVLGLAVQVKRTTASEPTRLIRVWAVGAVTPLEKALEWMQSSTGNVWHNYFYLRGVRAENRSLKAKIERMTIEQVRLNQDADQARRLQALLAFKEQFISHTTAAQVIGGSGSESSRSVFIDKGYSDGIRPDMAVITADGIVGKILHADPVDRHVSEVLLIDDQTSGVGAILDKSRLQGILRGTPSGELVLEKVMSDETVSPGELVLTSGGDRIFPKGLTVGQVTKVGQGSEVFLNIRVHPATDLGRLEEVLVVTKIDERQAEPDQTGTTRAIDILAARLPTVPPKPDDAAKGAAGSATPGTVAGSAKPATVVPGTAKPAQPKTVAPTTVAPATAGSDAKPKTVPPPTSTTAGVPAPRRPAMTATVTGSSSTPNSGASGSGTPKATPGKVTGTPATKPVPKPVKTDVPPQPKPQNAVEDTPH